MKINYKRLIIFILIPVLLGSFVGLIAVYPNKVDSIIPSWIFPVVWTILYILMGVSSYIIYEDINEIPKIFIIQLVVNLLWSFIFFSFRLFVLAYLWILLLIILVSIMIVRFIRINKLAGYLQIPYIIWLLIASYLNFMFII